MTRLILQLWKTHSVPERWKHGQESVKRLNPNYQYVLMNDEEMEALVRDRMPDYLPQYQAFEHVIERVDAFRYIFLYLFGGVYVDLDYEANANFDALFDEMGSANVGLVRSANIKSMVSNSIIVAREPGHPFFKALIDETRNCPTHVLGPHMHIMNHTGPNVVNRVFNQRPWQDVAILLRASAPCNVCNLNNCDGSGYVLTPLHGQS